MSISPPRAEWPALWVCALLGSPWVAASSLDFRPVPVAAIEVVSGQVEKSEPTGDWKEVRSGSRLGTGERLRTGPDALARVDFPWMTVWLSHSTVFALAPSQVLSASLEEGRAEQRAGKGIIKLRTPEALIRGQGHVVVRREAGTTLVSVLKGSFRVQGKGANVVLREGQGTLVQGGQKPAPPVELPPPPKGLFPGSDPVYVLRGRPLRLSWAPPGAAHHLQLLGLKEGEILMARDVGGAPVEIEWPWPGTFRWRVSARDERGLEGRPSGEGVVCVVEK